MSLLHLSKGVNKPILNPNHPRDAKIVETGSVVQEIFFKALNITSRCHYYLPLETLRNPSLGITAYGSTRNVP